MDIDAVLQIFKCGICKKELKVPKYLPCKHGVCEKCLQTHIIRTVPMSGYDLQEYVSGPKVEVKPSQDYFICPADGCDKNCYVPYPAKNTITWSSQINNSIRHIHFIELFHGRRQNDTKFCEVCIKLPNHKPAAVVCTDCLCLYCNQCTFIHRHVNPAHRLVDVTTFENASTIVTINSITERNPDCGTDVTELDNSTIGQIVRNEVSIMEIGQKPNDHQHSKVSHPDVCPIHSPRERVLFCKDCKVICCVKCSDTMHASCRNVHSIQTLHKKVQSVGADKTLKVRVASMLEKCSICINKYTTYESNAIFDIPQNGELKNNVTDAKKSISDMLKKLDFIYSRGKRCVVLLDSLNPSDTCKFVQIIFLVEKESMELQEEVLNVMGSDSDLDVNIRTLVKEQRSKMKTGFIAEGSEGNKSETKKMSAFDQYLHQFQLEMESDHHHLIDASADIELETRILAKSRSDTSDCWFTDCVLLDNMDIVVADHQNKKVKLIDKNQEICEIGLESSPWCIAVNEEDQMCYVTLNGQTKITLVAIRNSQLIVCSEIETHTNIYGIAIMDNERLLVTNTDHKSGPVCIISRDGNKENEKPQDSYPPKQVNVKPIHVKAVTNKDAGVVYISDFQRNSLVSYRIDHALNSIVPCNSKAVEQDKLESGNSMLIEPVPCYSKAVEQDKLESGNSMLTEPVDHVPCNSKAVEQDKLERGNSISVSPTNREDAIINSYNKEDDNGDSQQDKQEEEGKSTSACRTESEDAIINSYNKEDDNGDSKQDKQEEEGNSTSVCRTESEDARIDSEDSITEDDNGESKQKRLDQSLSSICSMRPTFNLLHTALISYPTGFDVDSEGNIFVCCNKQCQVLKLDKDGEQRWKLLEVLQPRALSLHDDRLILTLDTGPKQNYVMMYRLKPAKHP